MRRLSFDSTAVCWDEEKLKLCNSDSASFDDPGLTVSRSQIREFRESLSGAAAQFVNKNRSKTARVPIMGAGFTFVSGDRTVSVFGVGGGVTLNRKDIREFLDTFFFPTVEGYNPIPTGEGRRVFGHKPEPDTPINFNRKHRNDDEFSDDAFYDVIRSRKCPNRHRGIQDYWFRVKSGDNQALFQCSVCGYHAGLIAENGLAKVAFMIPPDDQFDKEILDKHCPGNLLGECSESRWIRTYTAKNKAIFRCAGCEYHVHMEMDRDRKITSKVTRRLKI